MPRSTAPAPPTTSRRARGRPRDPAIDVAILDAVRELLVEVGYRGTTMQAVADRAGVGLHTVYRRWPSKVALVHAAALARAEDADLDHHAPFAEQLRAYVGMVLRSFGEPARRVAILALLQHAAADPELLTRLAGVYTPTPSLFEQMISAAAARGEIASDADPEVMLPVIVGSALNTCLVSGLDDTEEFADRLAAFVLRAVGP